MRREDGYPRDFVNIVLFQWKDPILHIVCAERLWFHFFSSRSLLFSIHGSLRADALIFLCRFLSLVLAGSASFFPWFFSTPVSRSAQVVLSRAVDLLSESQSCSVWRLGFPLVIFVHHVDSILARPPVFGQRTQAFCFSCSSSFCGSAAPFVLWVFQLICSSFCDYCYCRFGC
jgi:hypothetical protein